ncbi:heavy-metal-associated domain-containing protein [Qipengyuania atrilutea]|uniref:Heavy-metal-associated domain-containing protein n=1 Tax=Qipengyuania atrilutea TaxID=2744473 RepID=A0A850H119_9SPHN|nr:heavy-metal-associated domain-containing protein [Actirhodobacter atriluteus]NVD43628.1 heavy-metal-associated domain-containing protein [Actirhodobacter atriluteus]
MMTFPLLSGRDFRPLLLPAVGMALGGLAVVAAYNVAAQVSGDRGIAPVAASSDIEVLGVEVDTTGDTPEEAREEGWREAQRKAWEKAGGPEISDSQLQSLVSAIVVEREQLGPNRYIATLGVIFNRQRAGNLLGRGGAMTRSAPLLVMPITYSAGTATMFEQRNAWQRAWAEYQAGASRIDYVRPSGAGGQSLLLTAGQTTRRSRYWWRNILDQFGATDVVIPVAKLDYTYPGGPISGRFTARYGPDNRYLDSFTLTARNAEELPQMLTRAVRQMNTVYERALDRGTLRPDPSLTYGEGEIDPALQRLIDLGRQLESYDAEQRRAARAASAARAEAASGAEQGTQAAETPTTPAASVATYSVQFATPDAAAFDGSLSAVRGTPGVRGASVSSTALGGTSVMSVQFAGSNDELAAALSARGFSVQRGAGALSISR